MLMEVEREGEVKNPLPDRPNIADLTRFRNMPERHQAYAAVWHYATMLGVIGNTFMWIYL